MCIRDSTTGSIGCYGCHKKAHNYNPIQVCSLPECSPFIADISKLGSVVNTVKSQRGAPTLHTVPHTNHLGVTFYPTTLLSSQNVFHVAMRELSSFMYDFDEHQLKKTGYIQLQSAEKVV